MSNLKLLRGRVRSIKSTQKITKAMQLVAASKLKKLKQHMMHPAHYVKLVDNILHNLTNCIDLSKLSSIEQKFFDINQKNNNALFIVVSSDKGLCGSFNTALLKKVRIETELYKAQQKTVKLMILGKKGYDGLKKDYESDIIQHLSTMNEQLSLQLQEEIMQSVINSDIGEVKLFFNKFANSLLPSIKSESILPLKIRSDNYTVSPSNFDYEGEKLLLSTISLYLQGKISHALSQSRTTEEQTRMMAMDNATKNAQEIIADLTLKLNRTRQSIITKELIEIISGASVL